MTGPEPESLPAESTEQPSTRRARRAARRDAHWNGPKGPRDWRYWVGGTGRVLVVTGLLMFGFVAYQLWGTGLEYARAQDELENEFADLLASAPTTASTVPTTASTTTATTAAPPATAATTGPTVAPDSTVPSTSTTTSTTVAPTTTTVPSTVPLPDFAPGEVLAQLEVPRVGLDTFVVSGVSPGDLKKGPGHYTDTPMPGQLGNSAIAGHRTTYGQPFFRFDEMQPGDEIIVTTLQGRFVYRVTGSEIVGASDGQVVATTDPTVAKLTLTTCHPRYTARDRLIVYAELDTEQSGPGLPPVIDDSGSPPATLPGEPATPPPPTSGSLPATAPPGTAPAGAAPTTTAFAGDDPTVTTDASAPATIPLDDDGGGSSGADDEQSADAFSHGWFSEDAAWPHVVMWGLATALVAIGGWLVARRFRRYWVGALVAIVPFVVALFFFYQNVNRLLPAAL